MIRPIWWKAAKRWSRFSIEVLAAALLGAGYGFAQVPPGAGQVSTPESSVGKPGDTGVRAHTNTQIFIPNQGAYGAQPPPAGGVPGAAGSPFPQAPVRNGATNPARQQ